MKKFLLILGFSMFSLAIFAQPAKHLDQNKFIRPYNPKPEGKSYSIGSVDNLIPYIVQSEPVQPSTFKIPPPIDFNLFDIQVERRGPSVWVTGSPKHLETNTRHKYAQQYAYLEAIKQKIGIKNPQEEYVLVEETKDDLEMHHSKMQQKFKGLPVFSGEVILHSSAGKITHMNGYVYDVDEDLDPAHVKLNKQQALDMVYRDLNTSQAEAQKNPFLQFLNTKDEIELLIYPYRGKTYLAYHLEVHPSHQEHWDYFIDATNGEVINKYNKVCNFYGKMLSEAKRLKKTKTDVRPAPEHHAHFQSLERFDGPAVGSGTDLLGQNREVHSYESGGNYFMIDASRSMFKSIGDQMNPPQGVIWTVDAQNIAPKDDKLTLADIVSGSSNFNYPTAVSAHANAGVVFEYFKNTHKRNSYNNTGGNLVSFINIVEEDNKGFDNAYWAGTAMYYGNGNFQFDKLPAGLDVAAHEMGHGTIFSTAGLVYQDEPGALNESFADIFGAMVDRDDWKIGDDIALTSFFPTGTMRDMQDPHNGGSRLGDPGYQPQFYNERYTGAEDNGGVHINSGIVNYVAYLIGTNIGKDKLEQIYYRALVNYLTRSSQFIDCRKAVIQSASDLYGANGQEAQIAAQAFDQAGILDGQGSDPQQDVESNQGIQLIAYIDTDDGRINLTATDATDIAEGLTNFIPISRPSITDDGSLMVYVSDDQIMRFIAFDWEAESYNIGEIENPAQPIWRNVVISKDGSKLAALTAEEDNLIHIIDLISGQSQVFELVNPTTQDGITNDNVLRADALEFDFSGEFLMYDQESDLGKYTFWDIGFLHFWDNASNGFAEGQIFKLVSGLPENVSIGNPTFAKNSPYIIALDYIEIVEDPFFGPTPEYYVYGFNIETGDYNSMIQGTRIGYPTYGPADDFVLFTSQSSDIVFDGISTLFAIPLNPDKISFADVGDLLQFKQYATWANWFAIGQRDFSTTGITLNQLGEHDPRIFPNPTHNVLRVDFELSEMSNVQIQVFDLLGKQHIEFADQIFPGKQNHFIDMSELSAGIYVVKMDINGKQGSYKVVKR